MGVEVCRAVVLLDMYTFVDENERLQLQLHRSRDRVLGFDFFPLAGDEDL